MTVELVKGQITRLTLAESRPASSGTVARDVFMYFVNIRKGQTLHLHQYLSNRNSFRKLFSVIYSLSDDLVRFASPEKEVVKLEDKVSTMIFLHCSALTFKHSFVNESTYKGKPRKGQTLQIAEEGLFGQQHH